MSVISQYYSFSDNLINVGTLHELSLAEDVGKPDMLIIFYPVVCTTLLNLKYRANIQPNTILKLKSAVTKREQFIFSQYYSTLLH